MALLTEADADRTAAAMVAEERSLMRTYRSMRVRMVMSARWVRLTTSAARRREREQWMAALASAVHVDARVLELRARVCADPRYELTEEDKATVAVAHEFLYDSRGGWRVDKFGGVEYVNDVQPRVGWAEELYEQHKGGVPW